MVREMLAQPLRFMAGATMAAALVGASGTAWPQDRAKAVAELKDSAGDAVGTVTMTQYAKGVVLRGEMNKLPPGWHAIHIHAVGQCEPDFSAAGGHFNPEDHKHGLDDEGGGHAGDLPNIWAADNGTAQFEILVDTVSLTGDGAPSLLDDDGSAVVIHAGPDDYATDPAGASGDRIACGAVTQG